MLLSLLVDPLVILNSTTLHGAPAALPPVDGSPLWPNLNPQPTLAIAHVACRQL
jgi:hypothetical protein